jgi:hypothetical protein
MNKYHIGDKIIHTKHGTDSSYQDVYYVVVVVDEEHLLLKKDIDMDKASHVIRIKQLHADQFKHIPKVTPITLSEDLFTL